MNPPSAIQGAMSRDRKPFTYTPGGLDLSEIKSERMAKRLMRNAMNEGVPETSIPTIQSPPMPSTPVALPNFNCLPVQVFPAFNLPANPKTLLRTRSNLDTKDLPVQRVIPPTFTNKIENNDTPNKNTLICSQLNNNRPPSMYVNSRVPSNVQTLHRMNYGSDGYTAPILPEISYDAEYFQVSPKIIKDNENEKVQMLEPEEENDNIHISDNLETKLDFTLNPISIPLSSIASMQVATKPANQIVGTDNEQREVKVVKKTQTQKENKVEEHNGDANGNSNVEAELTVKLPTKKSAAKTETKVEVVKKILPNGDVEEIKTTTTKTTIDGRTEIKTKTETTTIPKEEDETEEVEEEEDGEMLVQEIEEQEKDVEEPKKSVVVEISSPKQYANDNIIKTEERSETTTTTTRKVVVVEDSAEENAVEEETEDDKPVIEDIQEQHNKKEVNVQADTKSVEEEDEIEYELEEEEKSEEKQAEEVKVENIAKTVEVEEDVEQEEVEEEEEVEETKERSPLKDDDEEEEEGEEEEEYEEAEEKAVITSDKKSETEVKETKELEQENELDNTDEKVAIDKKIDEPKETPKEEHEIEEVQEKEEPEKIKPETVDVKSEPVSEKTKPTLSSEQKIPIREPSIPLEKVEDVEIKPIGLGPGLIKKSHTENTEIITSTIDPKGGISTQTEYNKVENIVTVNRTTKILDHNYENITQQGIPTVKTYFPPPSVDKISTSAFSSRPYQPVYPPEPTTERRHSLLLDRLSVERQIPVDTYQYSNQVYDQQTQWQDDPRAEVLTVSNVKPSSITNQQWYQQSKDSNVIYNNVPSSTPASQPWSQKQQTQNQSHYQPQTQYQHQNQNQYQSTPTPQTQYQSSTQPESQYQPSPVPQYQSQSQPQYQPYSEPIEKTPTKTYSYTPKPTWVSNVDALPSLAQQNQYSYNKNTSESSQKTTQQYSSSYVPPPWEQDNSYIADNNTQNYYQPSLQTTFTPVTTQNWKPPTTAKPNPISYIPPAPNKSFVIPVTNVEPPKIPGRKTYYSEYERRYITVPESTYVPTETKNQPQPDPSPQYYYDNNEPIEQSEPQWRKELREFTEKTTYTQTEQTNVKPPWEDDPKYAKSTSSTYTPTWSQTLRPRSWGERSFESEYVGSKEWPKTNTLGRGRPLSSFCKGVDATIPERTRGVSVDRYNPNSYQSPSEHPPVQAHTLTTPTPHASYHNPNVPAYHARASAEPREQPVSYQQRVWREARASPIQSRSFKYLQWITGTEN